MTMVSAYLTFARNLDRWRDIATKTPDVANETKNFEVNISKATTIDALLKDQRLFNYPVPIRLRHTPTRCRGSGHE